ncbi:hypothetical protein VCSRO45_3185 [Vibrio cholerae]|nr:hypothetical protein VCSRO45_3185 [Vibrio cholerae]
MEVEYFVNRPITPEQFVELLNQTTLGARRPTDNCECISGMLANTDLLVSAWIGERLVGIARSVTDFHYLCTKRGSHEVRLEHVQYDHQGNILIDSDTLKEFEILGIPIFEKNPRLKSS